MFECVCVSVCERERERERKELERESSGEKRMVWYNVGWSECVSV